MKKRIAVITGASSGMGKGFAETLPEQYKDIDEIWVIARRMDRLNALKDSVSLPVRPVALDLSDAGSLQTYRQLLAEEQPDVRLLINVSGFGFFCAVTDKSTEENLNMVDLNCKAVLGMCQETLPYMQSGAKILNIASVAAFQPIPYINVYGATKAFVLSFSRALHRELRSRGITVTALCPFWTKTEFFNRAVDDKKDAVVKKYVAMYEAKDLVARGWRDLGRGKDVSYYGFKARLQILAVKLLPHSLVMWVWMKQQGMK